MNGFKDCNVGIPKSLQRFPSTELTLIPLETPDLISIVLSFLSSDDLFYNIRYVNVLWNELSQSHFYWEQFCNHLWKDKSFITKYALKYINPKHSQTTKSNKTKIISNPCNTSDTLARLFNQFKKQQFESSTSKFINNHITNINSSNNDSDNDNYNYNSATLVLDENENCVSKISKNGQKNEGIDDDGKSKIGNEKIDDGNGNDYSPFFAFYISRLDCERNFISYSELISVKWNFEFRNELMYYQFSDDDNDIIIAQFNSDYTLVKDPPFHMSLVLMQFNININMNIKT